MREGWEVKRLGDIGKVSMCKRVFKEQTSASGDIPFFKIGTFGKEPDAFISSKLYTELRNKFSFPKKGDILISASGTIGRRVRYDGRPAYFQDSNIVWIDNDETQVLNDYLYRFYEICSWKSTKGATISRLYNDNLKQIEIAFPKSFSEQKSIVEILDEAFAAIDKAKANVEKNLQNAKELFESYLQNVFANEGEGWIHETLETLLEKGWITSHLDGNHGGEYPRKEEFKTSGVPYISANCIKGTSVDFSLSKFLSPERAQTIRKGIAINNDVLFAHNATVGPVALLKTNEKKIILGTSLTYYRCNTDYILPKYLAHYMRSKEFKQQYEIIMRQSTRNQVPITKQREFYHIIPPMEIQEDLVEKLEVLLEKSQKLEIVYQQKLNDLEELKKSILQKHLLES